MRFIQPMLFTKLAFATITCPREKVQTLKRKSVKVGKESYVAGFQLTVRSDVERVHDGPVFGHFRGKRWLVGVYSRL
jgi:hypothetical protein